MENHIDIYMDNSATTRPYDEVCDTVLDTMKNFYANPSSLHNLGKYAEDKVSEARRFIAKMINASEDEIYFTSGGTESDNIAILGYCRKNKRRGNKIITTLVEHPAVLECYKKLEEEGFEVFYAPVFENGVVDTDAILKEVDENTILVSVMHVNNETGAIMPIGEISKSVKTKNPNCAFFTDAVQSFGKLEIDVETQNIDMLSSSAHKIGGPNGVGYIYIMKKIRIETPVFGGGQEKTIRSGTHNVAGIMGFLKACEIKKNSMDPDREKIKEIKKYIENTVKEIPHTKINSTDEGLEYILNVSFEGLKSEVILHVLESNGIYVSSGSACSSKKVHTSHVLDAMGLKKKEAEGAIRFSFSAFNTIDEAKYVASVLKREIPILQKTVNLR
ncbi:MAG: cysteine desulfurase [Ruminococcaceae bacterium]|nr:cysteine desulfurase [Oscillospiraceae bacterium]